MSESVNDDAPRSGIGLLFALLAGLVAVALTQLGGLVMATVLRALDVTETSTWLAGSWLTGTALLGGWRQDVTSTLGASFGWTITAAGAPLLLTGLFWLLLGRAARRIPAPAIPGAALAGLGAALGGLLLSVTSHTSVTVINSAGTVTTTEQLPLWWTSGSRPGVVVGAFLLGAVCWLIHTRFLTAWLAIRPYLIGLLVIPGIVVAVLAGGALAYLASNWWAILVIPMLAPLLGVSVLTAAAGAPAQVSLTRITPEPIGIWSWGDSWLAGLAGAATLVVIAVIVGLVLRRRRRRGEQVIITVGVALSAGFITWAQSFVLAMPEGLGAATEFTVSWWAALLIAAVMAIIATFTAGNIGAAAASNTGPAQDSDRTTAGVQPA